jgi:hypothetical protein
VLTPLNSSRTGESPSQRDGISRAEVWNARMGSSVENRRIAGPGKPLNTSFPAAIYGSEVNHDPGGGRRPAKRFHKIVNGADLSVPAGIAIIKRDPSETTAQSPCERGI